VRHPNLLALLAPFAMVACAGGDAAPGPLEPASASFELLDATRVMDAQRVNVSVRGTFQVLSGDTPPRVLGAGGKPEAATFPGHPPAGPGTCVDGGWYNARGQHTTGSVDNPHPHCFDPGSEGITIVLEPISAQLISGPDRATLVLSDLDDAYVHHDANPGVCLERQVCYQPGGWGTVVAHAIDASTGQRVGALAFALELRLDRDVNPFACSLDGDSLQTGCINYIYTAFYKPSPAEEGGQGEPQYVSGFLYWLVM